MPSERMVGALVATILFDPDTVKGRWVLYITTGYQGERDIELGISHNNHGVGWFNQEFPDFQDHKTTPWKFSIPKDWSSEELAKYLYNELLNALPGRYGLRLTIELPKQNPSYKNWFHISFKLI